MPPEPQSGLQTYLRLLRYVKPHWRIFIAGVIGMVLLAATEAGIPALLKPVLDGTFVEKDPTYLTWAPLSLIALFLVRGLAQVASSAAFAAISTRLMHALREEMFDRLLRLPSAFYESNTGGSLVSKFSYNVSQLSNASVDVLNTLIKDSLIVIGLLAYVFWLDWQLSLFTFILLPTVALVAKIISVRQRRLSRGLQSSFGNMTHVLDEAIRGQKVIKIYGSQEYEAHRFQRYAKEVRHRQFKLTVSAKIGVPIVEMVGALIMATIIYIGASRAAEDQLTVGGFVAFFAALGLMFSPIKRLTKLTHPIQKGLAAAESVFALIDQPPEDLRADRRIRRATGRIQFEKTCFRYPTADQTTLGPVDLTVEPGKVVAFVGPSGGGKTTLVSLLPRLYDVSAGRVLLDGVDVQDLALDNLRDQIALVSQDVVLFNDTIAANIAYGKKMSIEEIREAARKANALGFIESMPDQFEAMIGENGVRLSGGQRQRIAIARALLKDAPILILDEATSALDTETEQQVQDAIKKLEAGRTTLVIAHRLSTVIDADLIVVIDQGKIVERGRHHELILIEGLYRHLYETQFNANGVGADNP